LFPLPTAEDGGESPEWVCQLLPPAGRLNIRRGTCIFAIWPRSGHVQGSLPMSVKSWRAGAAAVGSVAVVSRPGFVGGYDALASGMIIV
jgi:hypothetical protein